MSGASPSGPGSRERSPCGSPPSASIPDAIPREPDDNGTVEWIAKRLTPRQFATLRRLGEREAHEWAYASDVGAPATLVSLSDFRRFERNIWPPLILVTFDYGLHERHLFWKITDLGRLVLAQAIEARRAETQSGSVHESAGRQASPNSNSISPPHDRREA